MRWEIATSALLFFAAAVAATDAPNATAVAPPITTQWPNATTTAAVNSSRTEAAHATNTAASLATEAHPTSTSPLSTTTHATIQQTRVSNATRIPRNSTVAVPSDSGSVPVTVEIGGAVIGLVFVTIGVVIVAGRCRRGGTQKRTDFAVDNGFGVPLSEATAPSLDAPMQDDEEEEYEEKEVAEDEEEVGEDTENQQHPIDRAFPPFGTYRRTMLQGV